MPRATQKDKQSYPIYLQLKWETIGPDAFSALSQPYNTITLGPLSYRNSVCSQAAFMFIHDFLFGDNFATIRNWI